MGGPFIRPGTILEAGALQEAETWSRWQMKEGGAGAAGRSGQMCDSLWGERLQEVGGGGKQAGPARPGPVVLRQEVRSEGPWTP